MTPIPAAVATILATPAPVLIFDTCSTIDLFRRDVPRQQPRVPSAEIKAAAEILQLVTGMRKESAAKRSRLFLEKLSLN